MSAHPVFICPKQRAIAMVAEAFDVSVEQIKGPRRLREFAVPRQVAMYVLRKRFPLMGYLRIGRLLGRRDHSTIIHGVRRIEALMERDADLRLQVDWLVRGRIAELQNHHVLAWRNWLASQGLRDLASVEAGRDPETLEVVPSEKSWCDQCEALLPAAAIARCQSRFCSFREAA